LKEKKEKNRLNLHLQENCKHLKKEKEDKTENKKIEKPNKI